MAGLREERETAGRPERVGDRSRQRTECERGGEVAENQKGCDQGRERKTKEYKRGRETTVGRRIKEEKGTTVTGRGQQRKESKWLLSSGWKRAQVM